jgi:hypothetical protein
MGFCNRSRVSVAAALAIAIGVGTTAGLAAAQAKPDETVKSGVKITEGGPSLFKGKVTSNEAKCKKKRKVTLYYSTSPNPGKGQTSVGSTKTDRKGKWKLEDAFVAGYYHAEVDEDEKGDLLCRSAIGLTARC